MRNLYKFEAPRLNGPGSCTFRSTSPQIGRPREATRDCASRHVMVEIRASSAHFRAEFRLAEIRAAHGPPSPPASFDDVPLQIRARALADSHCRTSQRRRIRTNVRPGSRDGIARTSRYCGYVRALVARFPLLWILRGCRIAPFCWLRSMQAFVVAFRFVRLRVCRSRGGVLWNIYNTEISESIKLASKRAKTQIRVGA